MNIIHNADVQRFETVIDGNTAYLSYEILDEQTLNYSHTIVPNTLGGRGIGSALVKFALDYAKQTSQKVVPSCSFVAVYINKNPQYQDLIKHKTASLI